MSESAQEEREEGRYNFKRFDPGTIGPRRVDYWKLSEVDQGVIDRYVEGWRLPDDCSKAVRKFLERHHGMGLA